MQDPSDFSSTRLKVQLKPEFATSLETDSQKTGPHHAMWPGIAYSACHGDLGSEESLEFVRHQLSRCLDRHAACTSLVGGASYMPTRILDLGDRDNGALNQTSRRSIMLINSAKVTGDRSYACLSHRWNSNGHTIITTRETYAKHKDCISFTDLSPVYQDAVHISRRLGIRYLWIDSLCIIQDDAADWQVESQTMATVYGRALLTLARHCDMSGSMRETGNERYIVSCPAVSPPIYVREVPEHINVHQIPFSDRRNKFSLLSRGWVFQERLLSPRIVHISNEEIAWECMETYNCQCGLLPQDIEARVGMPTRWQSPKTSHARALGLLDSARTPNKAALLERWRSIVEDYSGLDLTIEADRLPAIRGCAEQIREKLGASYCFGLWESGSAFELAWSKTGSSILQNPRCPELFCLPTWSWAAVHGTVDYNAAHSVDPTCEYPWAPTVFKQARNDPCEGQTSFYWVITGQVMSGRLNLRDPGEVADRFQILEDDLELQDSTSWSRLHWHTFYPDFQLARTDWDEDDWYDITFLRLCGNDREIVFLVLWRYGKAIPGTGQDRYTDEGHPIYQRIGIIRLYEDGYENPDPKRRRWRRTRKATIALE